MQTIRYSLDNRNGDFYGGLKYPMEGRSRLYEDRTGGSSESASKWLKHTLKLPQTEKGPEENEQAVPVRRSRAARFANKLHKEEGAEKDAKAMEEAKVAEEAKAAQAAKEAKEAEEKRAMEKKQQDATTAKPKKRRTLRPRKALISLTPKAVDHLRQLLDQPEPQLIRIGVQNRGCSGLTYHLEYVTQPGKFDETVEQDGVKVLIDSKALFSIVGSEMDWIDDKLSLRFIFKNPNSKGTCGCGESFMV